LLGLSGVEIIASGSPAPTTADTEYVQKVVKHPVIAIALDAADPLLLEKWMSLGHLKNLNGLRRQGAYGRLTNTVDHAGARTESTLTERNWVVFNTGCRPNRTGFWDVIRFDPRTYMISGDSVNGGYDYNEYPPFYALGTDYTVAAFDIPVSGLSLADGLNGVQILGWGGHYPFTPSCSQPAELLPEIILKYGKNKVLRNDSGAWWNADFFEWLQRELRNSIDTRARICSDLLKRNRWDLFLVAFGETHSAAHVWWHLSQIDHPLYPHRMTHGYEGDPLLDAYEDVDRAVGRILSDVPSDAYTLCFAIHGMAANVTDVLSELVLPEMLYRFNFRGKCGIGPGKSDDRLPPLITRPMGRSWPAAVWREKYEPNPLMRYLRQRAPGALLRSSERDGLLSPYKSRKLLPAGMGWMPAVWYRRAWPKMKAFGLPAFAEGLVRINLRGREANGLVAPADYEAVCDEVTEMLSRLKDGRRGTALVRNVVRTRRYAAEDQDDPKLPPADLVVFWQDEPTDVVDSPELGRIGPVPYNRSGGHRPRGFVIARGPGIAGGSDLPAGGESVDLAPTILSLLGAPIPKFFDGTPLLSTHVA
jgi:predicted AlkP superfamily phosphohydrolase/phosphomutase